MTKKELFMKLCDIVDAAGLGDNEKVNSMLGREKKKDQTWLWVLSIVLAVAAIAGVVFAIYKHCQPEYLEDFDDDFEDDYEDDFFEDEEMPEDDIFSTEG